jgi:XTP/dITP diphosphohydrolase
MEGVKDRKASYHSFVALRHEGEIRLFKGTVTGKITHAIRGTHGFGYDPIFVPDEGDGRTFGEMSDEEKNAISHRARVFRRLGAWMSGSEEDF